MEMFYQFLSLNLLLVCCGMWSRPRPLEVCRLQLFPRVRRRDRVRCTGGRVYPDELARAEKVVKLEEELRSKAMPEGEKGNQDGVKADCWDL